MIYIKDLDFIEYADIDLKYEPTLKVVTIDFINIHVYHAFFLYFEKKKKKSIDFVTLY